MASPLRLAAFVAANVAVVGAIGFFGLPRLATRDAPASLTNSSGGRVVPVCPPRCLSEREQVLRTL